PKIDEEILSLGVPVLGICYGHQLIAKAVGGKVERGKKKEYGKQEITAKDKRDLFKGLDERETVWMSHGDAVTALPPGFDVLASTRECPIAAYRGRSPASPGIAQSVYGVQFHPEVHHTPSGKKILENFVFTACKAARDWNPGNLVEKTVGEARAEVGGAGVLMAVSGGVDSTVAAAIMQRAAGDRLHCVFVDTGLLRKNEAQQVRESLKKIGLKHVHFVDASKKFLSDLKGVTDPEEKRKRIGHAFIQVFEEKARELKEKHGEIAFLAQGTIYPDRIESAQPSKKAAKIKSHHNLTLPDKMQLKIIEPLKDFYKDDVRKLGAALGLPREMLSRHPFPGPGLAVRIPGEVTEEKLAILREADDVFTSELRKSGLYDDVWQAFAALLPVKTVGVMGDARTYEYVAALRAVTSRDGMTADWARLPHEFLEKVSNRIVNEVKGVNRVVYDITQKPPATIEYE
ncbi:MAG: glutamine-hydrolyzing GMP synthase, partial [Candidatus Micrarchaeota archaeon]|nr:glutamine-hydrolyzing GMP synthase [Candidatus Micrarchaeota archaeon]